MRVRFPGFARLSLAAVLLSIAPSLVVSLRAENRARRPAAARDDDGGRAAAPADPFPGLKFRNIGPATMGGRVDDLAVLESNPAVFYVGTATGGLWKTTNNGTTWEVLFDDLDDVVSIGDIAIAPERRQHGVGRHRREQQPPERLVGQRRLQVDRRRRRPGSTWACATRSTSRASSSIRSITTSSTSRRSAASGAPASERGVFKTTDGGLTWTQRAVRQRRHRRHRAGAWIPSNNKVLYAATYQRRRATWGFNGGGPGSAIYKSSDAGRTWTKLTNGIPAGPLGRIGMDVYRANPEHPLRAHRAREGKRHLSLRRRRPDVAEDVERQSAADVLQPDPHRSDQRPAHLRARRAAAHLRRRRQDVHRERRAALGSSRDVDQPGELRTTSSTATTAASASAGTRARRGKAIYNMDLGQFYHVSYDMETPYNVCGGLQDNYTWCGPSAVRSRTGIANDDWFQIQGGDGFEALIDPNDSRIIYAESQDGNIVARRSVRPTSASRSGRCRRAASRRCAGTGTRRSCISPHDPATIYVGANKVFKSDRPRPVVDGDQPAT